MPITFDQNTYAGKVVERAIVRALTGNETLEEGHAYLRTNVKSKLVIPRFDVADIIQDNVATPVTGNSGSATFQERTLEPQDYMIYLEFNPRDFEGTWWEDLLNEEIVFRDLPPEQQAQMLSRILEHHDEWMGRNLWQGDSSGTAPDDKFDGFITLLAADAATVDVATPVTLTAGNIIEKMQAGYALLPKAVRKRRELKCFMSIDSHELYGDALNALTYKSISPEQALPETYRGKNVVPLAGFPDDTLLWAVGAPNERSNLWVGANSVQDFSAIKVERLQANSELFFFQMRMKVGVQVGFPEETVLYQA